MIAVGGVVTVLIGALLAACRKVPGYLWRAFLSLFTTHVDILDNEDAYEWIKVWLNNNKYSHKTRRLSVIVSRAKRRIRYQEVENMAMGTISKSKSRVMFIPAPGNHIMFYRGRVVHLYRERRQSSENNGSIYRESISIRILSRNRQLVRDLIEEARKTATPEDDMITIRGAPWANWKVIAEKRPRPLESVILKDDIGIALKEDIEKFLKSEKWYRKIGIPYRRGYLLHGPPGSGKSSLVFAIASEIKADISVLNLASPCLTDEQLVGLLSEVEPGAIVLLEDIDCVFEQREKDESAKNGMNTVTFSGLLNAIDGVAASEGRILFMTTNLPEKLDSALIRPGRADVHFYIDNPDQTQLEKFFRRFYPKNQDLAKKFGEATKDFNWSMADAQGYLLKYRDNPHEAIVCLDLEQSFERGA